MNATPATTLPDLPEFTTSTQNSGWPQPEPDIPASPEGDPPPAAPERHEPPADPRAMAPLAADDREVALSRSEARAASPGVLAVAGEEDAGVGLEQVVRPLEPLPPLPTRKE